MALRILVGTVEVGGLLLEFAEGFRALGHDVTTVVSTRHRFFPSEAYDVDLAAPWVRWPSAIAETFSPLIRYPRSAINKLTYLARVASLIANHDVFLFDWAGESLLPRNRDFPLLKRLGKQIISIFLGSDVRHVRSYMEQHRELEFDSQFVNVMNQKGKFSQVIANLRIPERYSDLILSQANQSNLALRPYEHLLLPVSLSKYRSVIPGREVPLVVHAPSSKGMKGTTKILAALNELRNSGVRFDLRILDEVKNEEVLRTIAEADVVVDELYFLNYGKLGVESMASGCAYATCSREDLEPFPPDRPVWHIESRCLSSQLTRLLTDRELRVRLATEGRRYVEVHHDRAAVAGRILESLKCQRSAQFVHYPEYFARQFELKGNERVPTRIQKMTSEIVRRWGLPNGVAPQSLVTRGLMSPLSPLAMSGIPRWHIGRSPPVLTTVGF